MKTRLLFIALCTFYLGFSQVPSGYYDSANGLTGFTLKTELKDIISTGHVDQGYSALYTAYQTTDNDSYYEMDNTVLDMYTERPTASDVVTYNHDTNGGTSPGDACGNVGNTEGICYNREHLFPQGFFNELLPMRTDVHHVVPSDGYVNGQRSNFPFGVVGTPTDTYSNDSKRGPSATSGFSGTVFEPIDEFKGDIARMLLYFATRYEDEALNAPSDGSGTWDPHTASNNPMDGSINQFYETWYIELLVSWHLSDAVSQREIDRNNAAYNFQGNANPFIDHPEYVQMIWNVTLDTEAPTVPTNLMVSNETSNSIDLSWTASTDNTAVTAYDVYVNSVFNKSVATTNTAVNGLSAETTYSFTVSAKDAAGNESAQSTSVNGTTLAGGTGGGDCASETFTNIGSASSSYADRMWTGDDGGTWNATDARTDQTLTGAAITIRNGELTAPSISGGIGSLTVTTIRAFGGGSGTFTVRVNGTTVGTIPYSDTQETTTISDINITGNIAVSFTDKATTSDRVIIDDLSWTCYDPALGVDDFDLNDPIMIYPNPSIDGSITISIPNGIDNELNIYDITGKRIISKKNIQETIQLSNLPQGMLLIKIISPQRSITKKVIIQ
ncbi:endonuclease [uncultured Aquimarina sp.]|uniref:endonuclease n=1 Tax=uncultured Aquimarina sp. TaxID=575652 RepID=UPI0026347C07|nr:endonuclease [uncultured Aquimarina sp.]